LFISSVGFDIKDTHTFMLLTQLTNGLPWNIEM
jgi:hypothetical protein